MSLRLPIFDISDVNQDVAVRLVETASQYGFFYVKLRGSGIEPSEIAAMFDLVQAANQCDAV
jgi:isopenicillin N synthase-like dioxygenase